MKGCFSILFISVVLAFFASFFGRHFHRQRVEETLTQRVKTGLQAEYPNADVKYDHLTAIVTAPEGKQEGIRAKVKELSRGNGRVHFTASKPVPQPVVVKPKTPSNFTVFRDGNQLNLNGVVSSEVNKTKFGDMLGGLDGMAVSNNLSIGENTASFPAFKHAMAAVPAVMAAAKNGRIEASPEEVKVSGTVDSDEIRNDLLAMFATDKWGGASIVDNIKVKKAAVIPPPVVVKRTEPTEFNFTKKGRVISLNGVVDSKATKVALATAAQGEGIVVDDRLRVSKKVKAFSALAGATAIPALFKASDAGEIDLSGNKLKLTGLVKDQSIKENILAGFGKPVWKDYEIVDKIDVEPEPEPIPVEIAPYNFVILKSGDQIDLTGTVSSEETKGLLGSISSLEGATIANEINVGENIAKVKSMKPISRGFEMLLQSSENAKIEAKPKKLIVSGLVKEQSIKDDILSKISGEGWSRKQIEDRIKVMEPVPVPVVLEPVDFTILKKGSSISLSGVVDSNETKSLIVNSAKLNDTDFIDEVKVGENIEALPTYKPAVAGIPALLAATEDGKVAINSKRVLLSGLVKDQATKKKILDHFGAKSWQKLKVVDQIKVAPPAPKLAPLLSWTQANVNEVVLEGRVPDQQSVDSIVKSAKKRVGRKGKVVNNLKIQENVKSAPWLAAIPVFAGQSLPNVNETAINITEDSSSISGAVISSTVMNDVSIAFSGINPPGKLDVNLRIVEPVIPEPKAPVRDKIPELRIAGIGNELTASGDFPFPDSKKAVVDSILGIEDIDRLDSKKLAIGNDVKNEEYLKPLPGFIRSYYSGAIRERQIWLKNKSLTLEGIVPSEEAKVAALNLAKPMQQNGVKVIDKIRVIKPEVIEPPKEIKVQPPVNPETGELHSLYFGTGEYHIRHSQWNTAQALLAKAKATSGKIVIDGFADERGTSELNRFLSDERAKIIRSFLIDNGIDQKRIVSVVGRGSVTGGSYQQFRRTDVRILEE